MTADAPAVDVPALLAEIRDRLAAIEAGQPRKAKPGMVTAAELVERLKVSRDLFDRDYRPLFTDPRPSKPARGRRQP